MPDNSQLSLLIPDWDAPDKVFAAVTTRHGGVSQGAWASFNQGLHVGDMPDHVAANRARLLKLLPHTVTFQRLNQVHGDCVVEADGTNVITDADAVFTRRPGIVCCVSTADCLPVMFASLSGDVIGIAHAGWRGLAAGIIENCFNAMQLDPLQCLVWLGPAIGPCHFEVGSEVRDRFLQQASPDLQFETDHCFVATAQSGKYMADLYKLARIRLRALGISRISGGGFCSYCESARFYSYRRESVTGRMQSLIYLKPD